MHRLSFLIAGMQKAGTTALRHYLKSHPDLTMSKPKELHFFDKEGIDWAAPPYDELHAKFMHAAQGTIWGESTPIYTFWPPAIGRIARYNPNMKLIVLLRDPVARAYSHWAMMVDRQVESLPFSVAIRAGRSRVDMQGLSADAKRFSYVERGFYAQQVQRLYSLFPSSQVLFVDNQALSASHAQVLSTVCEFLGVNQFRNLPPPGLIFPYRKTWQPPRMLDQDRDYLSALYADDLEETEYRTGIRLSDGARSPRPIS